MSMGEDRHSGPPESAPPSLSNAEIADRLASLAQLLGGQKENPYKIKAYQRAAARIRDLPDSLDDLVRDDADLTVFSGIGEAIAAAIREIVLTGNLGKFDELRAQADPLLAGISAYPRLDPKRVGRIYKKLGIAGIEALRQTLESGEIRRKMGARMAEHVRQGLFESHALLLYGADPLCEALLAFLMRSGARRAALTGECRRRKEIVEEISFVVECVDFSALVKRLQRYGGRTALISTDGSEAIFALAAGVRLRVTNTDKKNWGLEMVRSTGAPEHLQKLEAVAGPLFELTGKSLPTEKRLYAACGLSCIEPELREGHDEIELAARGELPVLVTAQDIRGDLHAHSLSSDGAASIEAMAAAARERGYSYIGITDHSQSLKIARGVSEEDLWRQIRYIDKLNAGLKGIRVLKSSEVDVLADGSLDYPDALLKELDYTVCSIHSRFGMDRTAQTERLMRAMDNPYFTILGHATGRLLLKRPGYDLDFDRINAHARQCGCFFEINSSPDRLDLSAEHARAAARAGILIAVNTDSHSTPELKLITRGIDQARRAGLAKSSILNCRPLKVLLGLFRR
jgi:DNA polymerase (family 10)